MEALSIYDDLFSDEEVQTYRDILLYNCPFTYGEIDGPGTLPSGVVCDFTMIMESGGYIDTVIKKILNNLLNKIYEKNEFLKEFKLYRTYLNLFIPKENTCFHIDGEDTITCLYYINPKLEFNEGGETQFMINDEIRGIRSIPGRLVTFDGGLLHRATSFKSQPRLTLAFKFHK